MDDPAFERARQVFDGALTRPPDGRAAFLDEACGADDALRREVESLLAAHDEAGEFLSGVRLRRHRRRPRARPPHPSHRSLPDPRRHRPRRDGHRLPGGARRRRLPEDGRAEARARRRGGGDRRAPVPPGAADPRPAAASQHRHHPRRRDHRGRPALPGHGVRRGEAHHGLLRRPGPRHPPAARPLRVRVRRRPVRPPEPRRPPRPEARQHPGHRGRHAEAPRLRDREAPGRRGRSRQRAHRHAAADDDPGVRQPRAGEGRAGDDGQRRLLARRAALRAAGRAAAVRGQGRLDGGDRADGVPDRAASAQRSERCAERCAHPRSLGAEGRPRHDRHESAAQGPGAALRVGAGPRGRRAAPPGGASGARAAGHDPLPRVEVRGPAPGRRGGRRPS